MIIIILFMSIFLLEGLSSYYFNFLLSIRKENFFDLQKSIIQKNILLIDLCILQYEHLIKLFNYQLFIYLKDEKMLKYFAYKNYSEIYQTCEIKEYSPQSKTEINNINSTLSGNDQTIFIYCFSESELICGEIKKLIKENCGSYYHQLEGSRSFRIPFYEDFSVIEEYLMTFLKHQTLFTRNASRMKEVYDKYNNNGDLSKYFNEIKKRLDIEYNYYRKFFDDFENNTMQFLDLMYMKRSYIFENYLLLKDEKSKENYIKDQTIYFQTVNFDNDTTWLFNSWNNNDARFSGKTGLVQGYLDYILFLIASKTNIYLIPVNHENKKIMSKNLCYFFLLKQIIYINVTTDANI